MDSFIDLLRHGETTGSGGLCGTSDEALTARGWAQMENSCQLAAFVKKQHQPCAHSNADNCQLTTDNSPHFSAILSAPARRCAEFARQFATQRALPLHLNAEFRERDFGAWEGLTAAELPAEQMAEWWRDPVGFTPPAAESVAAFRARVASAWRDLLTRSARPSHQLLITHGGVIRVILAEVLRQPDAALWQIEVPHASLTRLRLTAEGQPSLVFHREP
jgi:alpha-ribazole phosphatase